MLQFFKEFYTYSTSTGSISGAKNYKCRQAKRKTTAYPGYHRIPYTIKPVVFLAFLPADTFRHLLDLLLHQFVLDLLLLP